MKNLGDLNTPWCIFPVSGVCFFIHEPSTVAILKDPNTRVLWSGAFPPRRWSCSSEPHFMTALCVKSWILHFVVQEAEFWFIFFPPQHAPVAQSSSGRLLRLLFGKYFQLFPPGVATANWFVMFFFFQQRCAPLRLHFWCDPARNQTQAGVSVSVAL